MYGYSGKILHIDLNERKFWAEENQKNGTKFTSAVFLWHPAYAGKTSK